MNLVAISKTILLGTILLLQGGLAKADDCSALINDSISWLQTPEPGYQHWIGFSISSTKAPARFVSYGAGSLQVATIPGRIGSTTVLKGQNIQTSFSDRTWCPELPSGGFCTGYQPFNYQAVDTQQLFLYPNGNARIVLTTWGNATYSFPLTCSNGFLYGTLVEPNGSSFTVVSLNKTKTAIPR